MLRILTAGPLIQLALDSFCLPAYTRAGHLSKAMRFFSPRNVLLVVTGLVFVNLGFAYPVLKSTTGNGNELLARAQEFNSSPLYERSIDTESLSLRDLKENTAVYPRSPELLEALQYADLAARGRGRHQKPKRDVIKFSNKAKEDIRTMLGPGHTEQQYKDVENWHRQKIQAHMDRKENGYTKADVVRGLHKGGFNPNEGAHITATFHKGTQLVQSHFKDKDGRPATAYLRQGKHHLHHNEKPPHVNAIPDANSPGPSRS
ncbi:hypothetical protein NMY22_g6535 [Coprinellus aureogranulatus]|nr:hypothetical protein NMY22_g6535 [Coprinellus aureogranulatus]